MPTSTAIQTSEVSTTARAGQTLQLTSSAFFCVDGFWPLRESRRHSASWRSGPSSGCHSMAQVCSGIAGRFGFGVRRAWGSELRWALAERSGDSIMNPRTGTAYQSLLELKVSYDLLRTLESGGVEGGMARFFELYYDGFTALRNEEDFFLLAMNYFERAAAMCVRYSEPFFDLQGHTRRGVSVKTVMDGFRRATVEAANRLNV